MFRFPVSQVAMLYHRANFSYCISRQSDGDDAQDLSVMTYCQGSWENSRKVLNAILPPKIHSSSMHEEEKFASGSQGIGEAFEGFTGGSTVKDMDFGMDYN